MECHKICQIECQIGRPDRMSEDLPDRMPDGMSEDTPDRMPDRRSEDITDRMSQRYDRWNAR